MLYWSPFNPVDLERGALGLWDIARALGVHGNTVKRRVKDMEEAGVLRGLSFFPNSTLVGVKAAFAAFNFDSDEACDAAAEVILARRYPGITMRLTQPEIRINLPVPADADPDEAAEQIARDLGAVRHRIIMRRYWDGPELTDLEMRVLKAMHTDVFATAPEVAEAVGVTPKTARKCIESLRAKKSFCLVPLVDYMQVRGLQLALIDVEVGPSPDVAKHLLRSFPDLIPNGVYTDEELNFVAMADSMDELSGVIQEMRSIPGVVEVRTAFPLICKWEALPAGLGNVAERLMRVEVLA